MPSLFPILIEVEEVAVGRVLRKLNLMEGIAHIRLKLQEEKREQLSGPEDVEGQVVAMPKQLVNKMDVKNVSLANRVDYVAMAKVLQRTPAHLKILSAAIAAAGGNAKMVHQRIYHMGMYKLIKRTAPGTYKLTDKGEKFFFGKDASTNKMPKQEHRRSNRHTGRDNHSGFRYLILSRLAAAHENDPDRVGLVSSADIHKTIAEGGYSKFTLNGSGNKMQHEGLIRYQNGFWTITEKGLEVLATPSAGERLAITHEEGLAANG